MGKKTEPSGPHTGNGMSARSSTCTLTRQSSGSLLLQNLASTLSTAPVGSFSMCTLERDSCTFIITGHLHCHYWNGTVALLLSEKDSCTVIIRTGYLHSHCHYQKRTVALSLSERDSFTVSIRTGHLHSHCHFQKKDSCTVILRTGQLRCHYQTSTVAVSSFAL